MLLSFGLVANHFIGDVDDLDHSAILMLDSVEPCIELDFEPDVAKFFLVVDSHFNIENFVVYKRLRFLHELTQTEYFLRLGSSRPRKRQRAIILKGRHVRAAQIGIIRFSELRERQELEIKDLLRLHFWLVGSVICRPYPRQILFEPFVAERHELVIYDQNCLLEHIQNLMILYLQLLLDLQRFGDSLLQFRDMPQLCVQDHL